MSETGNGTLLEQVGPTVFSDQTPPTVLYVTSDSAHTTSVPSILEEEHGIDVRIATALQDSLTRIERGEDNFDCIIIEDHGEDPIERELLETVQTHHSGLPVLIYANGIFNSDTGTCQEYLQAGVDDYLSKETDTEQCGLLARRIKHCMSLRQEHTKARSLETALEQIGHGIVIADPDGRIEYVNQSFETLGYTAAELTGRNLRVFQSDDQSGEVYQDFWETVTNGDRWSGRLTVNGKNGNEYSLSLTATSLCDDATDRQRIIAIGDDVSELAAYERKLEKTQQKYQALIDAAPDAIFVADTNSGEIIETNDAAVDLLERPKSEIIGMHQSELHPPERQEHYQKLFEQHIEADEAIFSSFDDDPIYVATADGDEIPVEINAKVIEVEDQTLIQGHFRDISERREREHTLEAILDGIPDLAIVYNESGEYEEVLTGRDDLLVDDPETLQGMDVYEALPSETADRVFKTIQDTLTTDKTQRLEYDLAINNERDPHWFEARTAPIQSDEYDSACVIFLARDITARKRRERDLRSFRKAVEHAGHVIMITDTRGEIEYVNPAFEAVTGYTETEVLGERPSLLKSGEHDDDFYQDMWETILSGEIWEGELINERKDGDRYYIEQTIAPITDDEGAIERFVAVNTDITDRKQYERQLKRERDRLDEFASTIAHDLRNPLSIALGHTELAQRTETSSEDFLEKAVNALERMDKMIDEVLTLSKQGKTVHDPETVRFDEIVDTAWAHVETSAATLLINDDLTGWTVPTDETRLCELLENLFRNAVEHGGSDVSIEVGRLSDQEGFYVADDGSGIPPENRNRIFESGFTTTDDGTGYGLAIIKQIAEAHDWEITVTEADTGGARFEIITGVPTSHDLSQSSQSE